MAGLPENVHDHGYAVVFNPYLILALVLAFSTATGGAFFYGVGVGKDSEKTRYFELTESVRQTREAALEVTAKAIAGIEVKHTTIRQELTREILEKPVYRDCRHTDDAMRLRNAARGYPDWQPPDSGELPAPATGQ